MQYAGRFGYIVCAEIERNKKLETSQTSAFLKIEISCIILIYVVNFFCTDQTMRTVVMVVIKSFDMNMAGPPAPNPALKMLEVLD